MTAEHDAQHHQSELAALSAEIENLETEIKEAEADAEGDHDNKDYIRVLTQHREQARIRLTDIQAAGENGWENLKYGLRHAWMVIKHRLIAIIPRIKL